MKYAVNPKYIRVVCLADNELSDEFGYYHSMCYFNPETAIAAFMQEVIKHTNQVHESEWDGLGVREDWLEEKSFRLTQNYKIIKRLEKMLEQYQ